MNTETGEQKKLTKFTANIRRYFITGLIAILPLWITIVVFRFAFKWISGFTKPILEPVLELFFAKEPRAFLISVLSFFFTILGIYIVGILASNIVSRRILLSFENLLAHIPILREIYSSARQLIQLLFVKKKIYRQVVLVEFPRKGIYSVGFVTSEITKTKEDKDALVTVFLSTTPNPTTGFLLILPKNDVIPLDINVDEAIKLIISGGIISSEKIRNLLSFYTEERK
ncbi:MAG: DUF502 domain-containing protein [Elusimicrobiota bacterium]|nr:DUF502 domain-containing protein [Elusimicrobiota bacterium]